MRILYVGQVTPGTTCFDRLRALERLGHEVVPFDVSQFTQSGVILSRVQRRFAPGVLLKPLNRALIAMQRRAGRFDMIWFDKAVSIFPDTLATLRRSHGSLLVHYTPDPQLLHHVSRHFIASLPLYDHAITTKAFEVAHYTAAGARNVALVSQSYCPVRFANPRPDHRFTCGVGLISSFNLHYALTARSLLRRNIDVGIWGPRWKRSVVLAIAPRRIRGAGVWGDDYVRALASFKIGLGLLSKVIPEEHTTRTFEIPAARTFLLAERTDEHCTFFEEGKEAEFFGSTDELHEKVSFYLRDDAARNRIAAAGRARCQASGYDNDSVLAGVMRKIART